MAPATIALVEDPSHVLVRPNQVESLHFSPLIEVVLSCRDFENNLIYLVVIEWFPKKPQLCLSSNRLQRLLSFQ